MQFVLIAILFVILVIALTLGFVIYRISRSATIKDVDGIVDQVNTLQEDLHKAIAKNKSGILSIASSNNQLRNDYINLNTSNLRMFTDLGVVKSTASNLSLATFSNNSNISTLQSSLSANYLTTTALNTSLNQRDFSYLHLDDSDQDNISYLKIGDGKKLQFCTANITERGKATRVESCSNVNLV